MTWLLLSVFCSTLIFVIFKFFDRFRVDNLQAIIVNYIVASTLGMSLRGFDTSVLDLPNHNWFPSAIVLGLIFIWLFRLMAFASQKIGVSVVSITVKMSLVIPVIFGILYYNESVNLVKVLGITLALVSVYLTTSKGKKVGIQAAYVKIPIFLFVGSGFMDTFINYNQEQVVPVNEQDLFTSTIFGLAAIFGTVLLFVQNRRTGVKLELRNLFAGIILGIPNYGSIYFLLKALGHNNAESSIIFPINNVGIVALSVIAGTLIFSEKLNSKNWIGILLAIGSILLLGFENF